MSSDCNPWCIRRVHHNLVNYPLTSRFIWFLSLLTHLVLQILEIQSIKHMSILSCILSLTFSTIIIFLYSIFFTTFLYCFDLLLSFKVFNLCLSHKILSSPFFIHLHQALSRVAWESIVKKHIPLLSTNHLIILRSCGDKASRNVFRLTLNF